MKKIPVLRAGAAVVAGALVAVSLSACTAGSSSADDAVTITVSDD